LWKKNIQPGHIVQAVLSARLDLDTNPYNEMMNEARALATKRVVTEAEQHGADAVVNIRYMKRRFF